MNMRQTLEQKRADSAWTNVSQAHEEALKKIEEVLKTANKDERGDLEKTKKALESGAKDFKKSYSGLARSLPALVQTDGLGQSLAFLRAKGKNRGWEAYIRIYEHLSGWVTKQLRERNIDLQGQNDLLHIVCKLDSRVYRLAIVESLAYLRWIKRFAEAELPPPEGGIEQ